MTDTYGELVSEIVDETRRSMSVQISTCILDAIAHHETERFFFNEARDVTFSLSVSQAFYTSVDHSMIPRLMEIDRFEITISTNDKRGLDRKPFTWIEEYNETNSSTQPVAYAYWGQSLNVTLPDSGYAARISGLVQLPSLSVSTDANAWTQRGNGKEIVKRRAMGLLYSTYLRDDANAGRCFALEQQALQRLRDRTTSLQASGEVEPCL